MSSQPPWETQIQPGWGSQPPPEQPPRTPQQPPRDEGWNQGSYAPPQPPYQQPPHQPPYPHQPQAQPQPAPPQQPVGGPYPHPQYSQQPQYTQQPPPPQFTPPQMSGVHYGGEEPPPKRSTGRVLASVVAVVVLLGAAGGIYLLTTGKSDTKAQPAATTSSAPTTTPASPASPNSASFPNNSYTGSAAPPASASSTSGGASLDSAATDKTPFTADALVAKSFTDDKNVTYALKNTGSEPCDKVGDAAVQTIVKSAKCTGFMAASWVDPDNSRIIVSAMIIPYQDAATATAIYKKLGSTHTGDYAQWCPPIGQPGNATCPKLAKGGSFTREGKFGSFHRYVLITTAVYVDLRDDDSQKDWLTSAAHGAFQNTLPGQ